MIKLDNITTIEDNMIETKSTTNNHHLTDTQDTLELTSQNLINELDDIAHTTRTNNHEHENQRNIRIELHNHGPLHTLEQIPNHNIDLLIHLLQNNINILLKDKLHENLTHTLDRNTTHLVDTTHNIDHKLDLIDDLTLSLFVSRSSELCSGSLRSVFVGWSSRLCSCSS
jgi:hypothetical protein